ncbi:hypothetical protein [Fibrella aquatilis]|uniref:Glycine zipper family protein n=1 Tax=Fibrella aquatilis TaxID=2817059 RepID=A0A939G5M4_9BACT|nr:hypothetical protein [Fibrella aquatilis]MBO0931064.1 hypothetical protein [Fibrella aquatilis]
MKLNLLFLFLFVAVVQASAQAVELQPGANLRDIKLYQTTVRTMTGEKIDGILYAMTDSTLVLFANNQATIRQFRAGQLPELSVLNMNDVKRISIRRKGHFLRQTAIGVGFGAAFLGIGTLLIDSKAGIGPVAFGVFIGYLFAPAMVLGGMGQGLIPQHTERILGRSTRFHNAYNHLNYYTIVRQF